MNQKVKIGVVVVTVVVGMFAISTISQNRAEAAIAEAYSIEEQSNGIFDRNKEESVSRKIETTAMEELVDEFFATLTYEEAEIQFEDLLDSTKWTLENLGNSDMPKNGELLEKVLVIEEEYLASKESLGENPSEEDMEAHKELMSDLYVKLSYILAEVETKNAVTIGDVEYWYESNDLDKQSPATCEEAATTLEVESIPGCETLEEDGLIGLDWWHCVDTWIPSEEEWDFIVMISENYSFIWSTYTGNWFMWETSTWTLIDSGVQEYSSDVDFEAFYRYEYN